MIRSTVFTISMVLASVLTMLHLPAYAQDRIPATVASVVDGDTIKVQPDDGPTVTVRLIGIDTPETKHPTKPVQCFGAEASAPGPCPG